MRREGRYRVAIPAHVIADGRYRIEAQVRIAPGIDEAHAIDIATTQAHIRATPRVPAWKPFRRVTVALARATPYVLDEEERVRAGRRR